MHSANGSDRGAVTLALGEHLDTGAALRARELLDRAPAHGRVILDFGKVRDVDGFALATLAVALAGRGDGRVALRGLSRHHARLLGYLGLDVDRLRGVAREPPDERDALEAGAALAAAGGAAGAARGTAAA